ncbi:MAG: hypothetical protein AB1564_12155, partial [Chloroflexota bacterium]
MNQSVVVPGSNNVVTVNYYPANDEKREMPTGWFLKHRYGLSSHFTGRVAEREYLTQWLAGNG